MKEITIQDMKVVAGGLDANACSSAILGSGGIGAVAGGIVGTAGGPIGSMVGVGIGALAAGAYAAAKNPACQPTPGTNLIISPRLSSDDGDE